MAPEALSTDEIRESFLKFFESQGHEILASDLLVPANDPSLMFTGAGMNQFKDEFMGRGKPDLKRAATSQKCLRTGDLENVGRTAAHHTFFEMLGNFSFGDYFKKESIAWGWDWLVNKMKLPVNRLRVSVHTSDDEAFEIWEKDIGVRPDWIYRLGDHDNFWPADAPTVSPAGDLCGPCSEIFYDFGAESGNGGPDATPETDGARFVEIWNHVFQQYEKGNAPGELTPLASKNIDTGMGLERIAAVLQGVPTNFETDLLKSIVGAVAEATSTEQGNDPENDRRLRRIADHLRGTVFCIGDGVLPGNSKRGYVVRRVIRRAVLDADHLGVDEPFLYGLVGVIGEKYGKQYPEVANTDALAKTIRSEEELFRTTLRRGRTHLDKAIAKLPAGQGLAGEDLFTLHDTYGFPPELTEQELSENGRTVDRVRYDELMAVKRENDRASRKSVNIFGAGPLTRAKESIEPTEFVGYELCGTEAKILVILDQKKLEQAGDDESIEAEVGSAAEGGVLVVLTDRTPFYAESGGEVGDTGTIQWPGGEAEVLDTQKDADYWLHTCQVTEGELKKGQAVFLRVDESRLLDIRRNHTATHLMHHYLRQVLGDHATQRGSEVSPDRLRFDFAHDKPVSHEELERIEHSINERILAADAVEIENDVPRDEGLARASVALFGEKYGDAVRLVKIGEYSTELCGGQHLTSTGDIGLFRFVGESALQAGVRRVEALTGPKAFATVERTDHDLRHLARMLKVAPESVVERVEAILEREKALQKELAGIKAAQAKNATADLAGTAQDVAGAKLICHSLEGLGAKELGDAADDILKKLGSGVAFLAGVAGQKVSVVCAVSKDLTERGLKAADILKSAGAKGGGKPGRATGGGLKPNQVDSALAKVPDAVKDGLN